MKTFFSRIWGGLSRLLSNEDMASTNNTKPGSTSANNPPTGKYKPGATEVQHAILGQAVQPMEPKHDYLSKKARVIGMEGKLSPHSFCPRLNNLKKQCEQLYADIRHNVESEYEQRVKSLRDSLRKLDTRLFTSRDDRTEEDVGGESPGVSAALGEVGRNMHEHVVECRAPLIALKDNTNKGNEEYQRFLTDNGIRKSDGEDLKDRLKRGTKGAWWVLIAIVLGESLLNGWVLMSTGRAPLLSSWSVSIMVSIVNIFMLGYAAWHCWRRMRVKPTSENALTRKYAKMGMILVGIAILVLNLFFAHYRDALKPGFPVQDGHCFVPEVRNLAGENDIPGQVVLDDPGSEAVCLLTTRWIILNDFNSYMLLFFGILLAYVSLIKWKTIDPGYPGHKERFRENDRFQRERVDVLQESKKNLKEIYRNGIANMDDKILRDRQTALQINSDLQAEYERLIKKLKQVSEACAVAIRIVVTSAIEGWGDPPPDPSLPCLQEWEDPWELPAPPEVDPPISQEEAERFYKIDRDMIAQLSSEYTDFLRMLDGYADLNEV